MRKIRNLAYTATLNGNIIISNNIGATTVRCIHGSGAWTGRNLILDEVLRACLEFRNRIALTVCEVGIPRSLDSSCHS